MLLRFVVLAAFANVAFAQKDAKAFSLFNVVTFKNNDCVSTSVSTSSGPRNGTCYTSEECTEKGGMAEGGCAMGFGTCCVFAYSDCSKEVSENCTYVRNENFPTAVTASGNCAYKVKKCKDEVCSLRLDFETFNILAKTGTIDSDAGCDDTFTITGLGNGGRAPPTICGMNTGQHIFVDIGTGASAGATLSFAFANDASSRTFEIKVTQYECGSPNAPPAGCLQWYTGTEGRLQTFNFEADTSHLPDQQYNMCIRQEAGFCCVEYRICDGVTGAMSLFIEDAAPGTSSVDTECTEDWIQIEGSDGACNSNTHHNRYCGSHLAPAAEGLGVVHSTSICDCTAPFRVGIVTDATEVAGIANDDADTTVKSRGVCLDYVQRACALGD